MDPDAEEEALMDAVVSVVLNESGELIGVFKPGGVAEATETTLMHCVAAAKLRYPAASKAMDDAFGPGVGGGDSLSS